MIVDYLQKYYWFENFVYEKKLSWFVSKWTIESNKIIFFKTDSYMNLSWWPVLSVLNYYKISNEDMIVVYDDIDLSLWKIRKRFWWSNGWHNGIRNIESRIWTNIFWKIKIWIWRPERKEMVASYVLSNFKSNEYEIIMNQSEQIVSNLEEFIFTV